MHSECRVHTLDHIIVFQIYRSIRIRLVVHMIQRSCSMNEDLAYPTGSMWRIRGINRDITMKREPRSFIRICHAPYLARKLEILIRWRTPGLNYDLDYCVNHARFRGHASESSLQCTYHKILRISQRASCVAQPRRHLSFSGDVGDGDT